MGVGVGGLFCVTTRGLLGRVGVANQRGPRALLQPVHMHVAILLHSSGTEQRHIRHLEREDLAFSWFSTRRTQAEKIDPMYFL